MESIASRFVFDDGPSVAKIAVVGVGGGGGNAVNNMVDKGIQGVDFVAINTDAQALGTNRSPVRLQAGSGLTRGLGAGARPSVGAEAVEESRSDIENALRGYDMVFVTAGMGGGTGTGGAPVVAQIARKLGILTVAVVTKPFSCEGNRRTHSADQGIALLKQHVDTIIVIPNERLLDIATADTSLMEAFAQADDVLYNATRGISDLITMHGLINLDFADVKTTIKDGGTALMGSATAAGEARAERAAIEAISSPLLDGLSISGARNVLVNITAGRSLGVRETAAATDAIKREAGDDVEVILGTVIDDAMGDDLRVTVIATGFEQVQQERMRAGDGLAVSLPTPAASPVAPAPAPAPAPVQTALPGVNPHRLTAPVDNAPRAYKGEDAILDLDAPAYTRRTQPGYAPATPTPAEAPGLAVRRRRSLDEAPERTERPAREAPAFLRKMMD